MLDGTNAVLILICSANTRQRMTSVSELLSLNMMRVGFETFVAGNPVSESGTRDMVVPDFILGEHQETHKILSAFNVVRPLHSPFAVFFLRANSSTSFSFGQGSVINAARRSPMSAQGLREMGASGHQVKLV
jgi:hypothetical protein